jgi:hypothetical protein
LRGLPPGRSRNQPTAEAGIMRTLVAYSGFTFLYYRNMNKALMAMSTARIQPSLS